ncbi:hypothetical protein M404DRAFT_1002714 [Pisolithus tinctorius Marx 270]|uniref:Uncharacterized protein n=1 Tax=Pisolithus tinctorius Marx 270 TaxID=870435 RepID=A0A0C3NM14_PISTI|nr:hypothetical protein M404DRAFT_1002714 [Pisolithus tinctorius Marx 270]
MTLGLENYPRLHTKTVEDCPYKQTNKTGDTTCTPSKIDKPSKATVAAGANLWEEAQKRRGSDSVI